MSAKSLTDKATVERGSLGSWCSPHPTRFAPARLYCVSLFQSALIRGKPLRPCHVPCCQLDRVRQLSHLSGAYLPFDNRSLQLSDPHLYAVRVFHWPQVQCCIPRFFHPFVHVAEFSAPHLRRAALLAAHVQMLASGRFLGFLQAFAPCFSPLVRVG